MDLAAKETLLSMDLARKETLLSAAASWLLAAGGLAAGCWDFPTGATGCWPLAGCWLLAACA